MRILGFGRRFSAAKLCLYAVVGIAAFLGFAIAGDQFLGPRPAMAASNLDNDPLVIKLKKEYRRPATIPFPEENPYSKAKAELGKTLYFDPRLSSSNVISCATCHNPGFAWGDGLAKGVGHGMKTLGRRSPTILNAAWGEVFMWDGRFDTLEEQALGPIEAPPEMNMPLDKLVPKLSKIREYKGLFQRAFPKDGQISLENIAKAIATFERTVVSGTAPFDRWISGKKNAISDSAKRGFVLFNKKAECAACHSSWRFTDDSFHDIGLADADIGRGEQLPDIVPMQHAFKTPGLRNIDRRGPFMHDGSVPDLLGVIDHYDHGGVKRPSRSDKVYPLKLTRREKADLIAFLKTLTSKDRPVRSVRLPRGTQG